MPGDTNKRKLRPLGRLELFHHVRNKLGFYNSVASTAQYVLPRRILDDFGGIQAITFAVLKAILCRQPIMGVSVVDEMLPNASWVRLDTIDLRQVTEFRTISGGQQFIEDEHQKSFDRLGELPLWRVVVAEHQNEVTKFVASKDKNSPTANVMFDVGFFYSHAMGDGMSGAAFHLDFLDALNALAVDKALLNNTTEPVIEIPKLNLLQNLEAAARWPLSIMFIGSMVVKELILGNKDSKRWSGPPVLFTPGALPKSRLLCAILDSTTAAKIVQVCHRNRATITPLLTVLIARHLATAYPSYSRFPGIIAIQLRRFTGVTNRQMVNQVSGVTVPCSTEKEKGYISCKYIDWDVVRSCKTVIDEAVKSPADQATIMLKFMSDMAGFFRSKIGKIRNWSFELSNLGLIDGGIEKDSVANFGRIVFSQSANVAEAPYVFSVASVKGGDMTITLTWQEGVLEEDKAKQVLQALEAELYQIGVEED